MRYLVHIDGLQAPDDLMLELADDAEARSQALVVCGELLRNLEARSSWPIEGVHIEVMDQSGRSVATFRFTGAGAG